MNKNKSYIIGIVIVAVIGIIILISRQSQTAPTSETSSVPTNETSAIHETTNPSGSTTSNTQTTTTAGQYTLATVATHNSQSSCWTTINGSVYDVTSWISQHPGGEQAILGLCGIDGSDAFNGQHGGQRRPATELASFKIGILK